MPRFVHARRTPEGVRFRLWSTIVDRYVTPILTYDEMRDFLVEDAVARAHGEADERLNRAGRLGTSSRVDSDVGLDEPWETELCRECHTFHHAFVLRGSAGCSRCGEPEADVSHRPPCTTGAK